MSLAPWMGSVILTPTNTNLKLSTLLAAKEANLSTRLMLLVIEFDLGSAGNVRVTRLGGSDTDCGAHLVPSLGSNIFAFDAGLINTADIYLRTDTDNAQINIIALPVGA